MELTGGFKKTEVGEIPNDWDIKPLHSISEKIMVGIASAATHAYRSRGVVMFRNQNIKPGFLDDSDVLYISEDYEERFKNKRLKGGDLLTARTGYPGTTSIVPKFYEGAQSFTTLITRPRRSVINSDYLCCFINSGKGQAFFEQNQIGGGQKNVNAGSLKNLPVPIPPSQKEQEAIADALSDADALIESLEQLLAKKRHIKQGTMQELLTGKKRLPGFNDIWEICRLGELGFTFGGLTGKTKHDFGHGSARYIPFMNIMINIAIDCLDFERVDVKSAESQNHIRKGDLFFNGSSETPEEVGLCSVLEEDVQDVFLNSFCFGFRFHTNTLAVGRYLAYYFRSGAGRDLLKSLAQGATRYNLSKTALLNVRLPLPKFEEQTAIATILSDMDAELAALEAKLDKARQIKQGMMQELLTGRIRLV
jgi:type I restriction enzyme S subunit